MSTTVELTDLEVLANHAAEADLAGRPAPEAVAALRHGRAIGLAVPVEYGGLGGTAVELNREIERVATVDASSAIILFQHYAVCARIADWGTAEQRRRYLPGLASGELLAASAWSETGAGAAKKKLATVATRTADGWLIDGAKSFTTGAGLADVYLVLAQTEEVPDDATAYGSAGQSFFLVDAHVDGVVADLGMDLVGMRASATGFVQLRQARVGADAQFGPLGEARRVIASVRDSGATLGAVAVGVAQAAYDTAFAQARSRGLASSPALRHRFVDLRVQVEAARAIVEWAGRCESPEPGMTTLYSKLFASNAAEQVCAQAARLMGSAGFIVGNPINRYLRDARAVALMGPTDELSHELVSQSW